MDLELEQNYTPPVHSVDVTPMGSAERHTLWYAVANWVSVTWVTTGDVAVEARGVLGWVPPSDGQEAHALRGVQLVDVETGKVVATQLVMD